MESLTNTTHGTPQPEPSPFDALTPREAAVAELLSRGQFNREAALVLGVSIKTVDTHRGHVLKKLGLRNNSELTRAAIKHGLAPLE